MPATAQHAPELVFPVDCTLGETCMIQQVMDRDPGPGVRDFLCGPMSYDGYGGTDIRVPDMQAMQIGWPVLAAAPGIVRAARDGVPDNGAAGMPDGQDCGNRVIIDHADGWQTQYCHMAEGSVSTAIGARVVAGQPIGEIGFSGNTEFPHLHFTLRLNGETVDPFDPSDTATCGAGAAPLWAQPTPLSPGGILSIGFADAIPNFAAIRAGTADADLLAANGEAFVFWSYFYGGRAGDVVRLVVMAPDGTPYLAQDMTLDRTQADAFRATGRHIRSTLPQGDYTGTASLIRNGTILDSRTTTIPLR